MAVKVPNQFHPLVVSLDERQSPLAARFFHQQLSRNAWSSASLVADNDDFIVLGPADPHPLRLAKTRPQKFAQRGLVAFAADSDTELIINMSGKSVPAGPVLGKLTTNSLNSLTAILTTARGKRRSAAEPGPVPIPHQRRRKIVIQPYDEVEAPSEQLKRLKSFEERLASWQVEMDSSSVQSDK